MEAFDEIAGHTRADPVATRYSIVVPIYNELDSIDELHARIVATMAMIGSSYEIVFVSDGSDDGSDAVLARIAQADARVVYLRLRRNFGQATALQAGFDQARGEVLISMDGDLQHDPAEIPQFVAKIDEGFDIVSGWRVKRSDNALSRQIPSRIANWLLAKASGLALHDFGTTFKAYRREVLEDVRLYGDMHRFVPAMCARLGATITEIPISNIPRASGKSHYGIGRTFRVAMDLLTMRFMTAYLTRPLHFFGKWGLVGFATGAAILIWLLYLKVVHGVPLAEHEPLTDFAGLLCLTSVMLLATGLIGEFMARIYFESAGARTYAVQRAFRGGRRISTLRLRRGEQAAGAESGLA